MRMQVITIAVSALILIGCGTGGLNVVIPGPGGDTGQTVPDDAEQVVVELGGIDFTPLHIAGDRDFKGHGPLVELVAEVRVNTSLNVIEFRVSMAAEEWENGQPKDDYTTAAGWSRWYRIRPPAGKRFVALAEGQPTHFLHGYLDTDHENDTFLFPAGGLIEQLTYTGDIRGEDAGIATGVLAWFRPVRALVVDADDGDEPNDPNDPNGTGDPNDPNES